MLAQQIQQSAREISHRTRGSAGGPITRLMSPSDLGEVIKPFVFLDHFDFEAQDERMSMDHGWHPHSGIATVTVVLEGSIGYAETTGKSGVLSAGSVEWMRAGAAALRHGEEVLLKRRTSGGWCTGARRLRLETFRGVMAPGHAEFAITRLANLVGRHYWGANLW